MSGTEAHPYSDAVVAGGLVFVSGSLALRPDGVVGGRAEALAEAMETVRRRLATVNARIEDVIKATYYLTDITLRDEANAQFCEVWTAPRPARTVVEVADLPYGSVVEIDIVALAR
ncbi:enamine deaminase RidA (YjgF/YER057c/UK114 family) [Kribbella orskensis]|uniref:Enamine deaminase RidA (YjgF/YER057c/UK114 family) n=1 Tax=Kribbella orskensis TaxID=2512216 RepID=A0ABY2BDH9_9ACTN|nr:MULTISPECIES: RidA family protein [Kribbella]TCN35488.1 enamine deaminase RidA (YjgF/YER057c/UK114 family) [Kribbella sp. VKM Ac-2500]TCO17030.1 enamine deaminase RidA (YjgF/YER057c/UK114 family) [Kribbella orskensis]